MTLTSLRFLFCIILGVLSNCGDSSQPLPTFEVSGAVFVDTEHGDPFVGNVIAMAEKVGELERCSMITSVFQNLRMAALDQGASIPSMGVVARVEFVDQAGKMAGSALLYLPHGLLVLRSNEFRSGRFPEFNKAVLAILKDKKPDHIADLEETLRTHGFSLATLTESEDGNPRKEPSSKEKR